MLLTAISWGWIGIAAFLCGFFVLQLFFHRENEEYWSLDLYLMAGLCVLTVYAQVFSLFYKVGALATVILAVCCMAITVGYRRELREFIRQVRDGLQVSGCMIILVMGMLVLCLTVQYANHYDTGLYHAQSIRWIEEYGVVKGLGNLHNRLAYNSAFFSLQALFSMKFMVNQSLHTLNGFIVFLMCTYAVSSLNIVKKKKAAASDLFKLAIILYVGAEETKWMISSPGSDISVLTLILYLCAKWSESVREDKKDIREYGVLCLLAVWAVTLKLSAGAMVLLAIYPAVEIIRHKRWKLMGLFLAAGLLIILPFLARNVVISGYLLYPYSSVDLFDVDWKMNQSVVEYDSKEIMAWGRGMSDTEYYDAPFRVWFPAWYQQLDMIYRIAFAGNVFCVLGSVIYFLRCFRRKTDWRMAILIFSGTMGLLLWFFTSPLVRYGMVYMLILPCSFAGILLEKREWKLVPGGFIAAVLLYQIGSLSLLAIQYGQPPLKRPLDYSYYEVEEADFCGLTIYVPRGTDQAGYHFFPSTPYGQMLERIELRTGELEDGFRVKAEYADAALMNNGGIME